MSMSTVADTVRPTMPLTDTAIVHHFREDPAAALAALGVSPESAARLIPLRGLFRNELRRDPRLGELRILDALTCAAAPSGDRHAVDRPALDRHAVGELYTDSPAIAETWADMMDKHAALARATDPEAPVPPCTYAAALTLTARYLSRTRAGKYNRRKRTAPADALVLPSPVTAIEAAVAGYHTTVRTVAATGVSRVICTHRVRPLPETPEHTGDLLLLLRRVTPTTATALVEEECRRPHPEMAALRAVTRPLLLTVAELCTGADLYADRLLGTTAPGNLIPTDPLCARSICADGTADILIRTPVNRARALTEALRALGLPAIVVGQVRPRGRMTLHLHGDRAEVDSPILDLPTTCLVRAATVCLHAVRIPHSDSEAAIEPTVHVHDVIRLPDEHLTMVTATAEIPEGDPEAGYETARQAVSATLEALTACGADADRATLTVSLRTNDDPTVPDGSAPGTPTTAGAMSFSVICGLYRATAEQGIPLSEAELTTVPDAGTVLSVTAWIPDEIPASKKGRSKAPILDATYLEGATNMPHTFEPLSAKPRAVILDTDIGPDCDDVGALITLIHYAKIHGFPIAGICNCTSNRAGTGTVDAICRHCGMETPPLGQWSAPGFMDDPTCHKYNDAVAERFSPAYRDGTLPVEDAVTFYRRLLATAPDGGMMIISIGMFNDLAALLRSPADEYSPLDGASLVRAKVYALVSMAAILPEGRECNVVSDYKAAEAVFAQWPTPIYLSDFHIGLQVYTGYSYVTDPAAVETSPAALAYHLYTKDRTDIPVGDNSSYDLTAVQFAVEGEGTTYGLGEPGRLEFYAEVPNLPDATRFIPDPAGRCRFMTKRVEDAAIAEDLNRILREYL